MNTTFLIVILAMLTVLVTAVIQVSLRGRGVSPTVRRLLWGIVIAGIAVMVLAMVYVVIR